MSLIQALKSKDTATFAAILQKKLTERLETERKSGRVLMESGFDYTSLEKHGPKGVGSGDEWWAKGTRPGYCDECGNRRAGNLYKLHVNNTGDEDNARTYARMCTSCMRQMGINHQSSGFTGVKLNEQVITVTEADDYGQWKVLKTLNSHAAHFRFLSELPEDEAGWFEQPSHIKTPYSYSKYRVFYVWNGKRVWIAETRHKYFQVLELPAGIKTWDHDPSYDKVNEDYQAQRELDSRISGLPPKSRPDDKGAKDDKGRVVKEEKYLTCPECEANFPSKSLVDGKLPAHKWRDKTCPGVGMLGEDVPVIDVYGLDKNPIGGKKRKDITDAVVHECTYCGEETCTGCAVNEETAQGATAAQVQALADKLSEWEARRHRRDVDQHIADVRQNPSRAYGWEAGQTEDQIRQALLTTNNYYCRVTDKKKYINMDAVIIGQQSGSGKFMVDKETGVIYGIKGYGVVHKGYAYGTVAQPNLQALAIAFAGGFNSRSIRETPIS